MRKTQKNEMFPVVAIGASAGGFEAVQELFKYLPHNTGMAFIFVMHLSPDHKSVLSELLARKTRMSVCEAQNRMLLEANHVYVIPPDRDMLVSGGRLILHRAKESGFRRLPVDSLFRSLAQTRGGRAIGVILSGTASDGTLGAEAIKAEGGITFAQDPVSAQYDGMPQSAIAAGCIDFVLSPRKIAQELCKIARHPFIASVNKHEAKINEIVAQGKGLESVCAVLRQVSGVDFSHYKSATITRRVQRRMVLLKIKKLKDYTNFLKRHSDEVASLCDDLLINVTEFFRDERPFQALQKNVLPSILKNRAKDQEVRVWVPGCSSGEEAYSIAICFAEALGSRAKEVPVKIFATDLSDNSINKARRGIYGKNIKESVSAERLKRFFLKDGDSYKVAKSLREMCVFSRQNLCADPPFSNLDLISCRNLLIYLQPVLQKKAFNCFHYSLKTGGFLLLGVSESVGGYANLFRAVDQKNKIFEKKYSLAGPMLDVGQRYLAPQRSGVLKDAVATLDHKLPRSGEGIDIDAVIGRAVEREYAPCGVLIDSDMEVISFRGKTGRFLESASGKPTHDIFKLVREGLASSLRVAINEAGKTGHRVKKEGIISDNGRRKGVFITVIPIPLSSDRTNPKALKENCFLVLFQEIVMARGTKGRAKVSANTLKDGDYLEALHTEIADLKSCLRTVTEEAETVKEELTTANEEILSSNEELQSTNEELETSKEELQSSNEELITTNEELQNNLVEKSRLNNDLVNLFGSINLPIIMVDKGHVIRRVNPQAEKVLNVIPADIGRAISRVKLNPDIPDLDEKIARVMDSLQPQMFEIRDREANWYLVHLKPYRTTDDRIDGVVMVCMDITQNKKAEKYASEAATAKAVAAAEKENATEIKAAYQKLKEAQDMLIQSEKMGALGVMSAGVAHELNNPLAGIMEIIRYYVSNKDPNDKEVDDLKQVLEAGERMTRIIRGLLDFSRHSAGDVTEVNCNDTIDVALSFSQGALIGDHIEVRKDFAQGLPMVRADKTRIMQIIVNIVSNAVDAMDRKGVLRIATRAVTVNHNRFVEMEFTDNGCGIAKKDLHRIFTPFFTTKSPGKGTGLGLAVVHSMVKQLAGDIIVESPTAGQGQGASFKVRLPAIVAA
ncbi:MAG: PAS domain-containing protein [Candidatus Omnitrophica bacterium]|nr:PAS domain-containing protein [Candidatus Omnitrophota bacterium]